ncbi:MAG: hypothetical protein EON92_19260 [Burkholderiales bacterium]|nr:MAG: hypothetical protein EON92_19260 [Burkholderiales bacterium]
MRLTNLSALMAACLLAGCGVSVKSTSPRSVVIRGGTAYTQEAQTLADQECAKNGRLARMVSTPGARSSEYMFDCVN